MNSAWLVRLVIIAGLIFFSAETGFAEGSPYITELTEKMEQGDAEAQFTLGVCYFSGIGTSVDQKKGIRLMEQVAEQCHKEETLAQYYNVFDPKQAVKWRTKAAEKGDAEAQFNLAVCYDNGKGVLQDDKQAVYWYTKAAEQGDADAQYNLGNSYSNGEGVLQDYKQAVYWYTKAAEQGHAEAQNNLCLSYAIGRGVLQDYAEAYAWALHAALNGSPKPKEYLAEELTPDQIASGQIRAKELQRRMVK